MCYQHIYIVASNATVYRVIFAPLFFFFCPLHLQRVLPCLTSAKTQLVIDTLLKWYSCLKIVLNLHSLKFNEGERGKRVKIQTGANISLYTVYHPIPSCYIYIYTALYASQTKLWTLVNVCICWQQILSNMWPFGMSFIHEWTSFFLGGGGGLGSEFFEWECQSTLSNL